MHLAHRPARGPVRVAAWRRLCALVAGTIALAACGGGDGVDEVEPPTNAADSGLSAPTAALALSDSAARLLARMARDTHALALGGVASRLLGNFTPGIDHGIADTFACTGGGTVSFTPAGPEAGTYTYDACVIDGVSYTGTGAATMALHNGDIERFTIAHDGVTAVVAGTPVALDGHVDCAVADDGLGAARERPQHVVGPLTCVGHHGGIAYGSDFHLEGGAASGWMQWPLGGGAVVNSYAKDVDADGGALAVEADTGRATIRRLSAQSFQVAITIDGFTEVYAIPVP